MISYWGVEHDREVSKKQKKDWSGAAVGSGTALGTVGLVGGGIPGTKAAGNLGDVKNAKTRPSQAAAGGRAYRAGEFGYRHNAHHTYKTFNLQDKAKPPKHAAHADAFWHGRAAGQIKAEDKILRHLKVGQRASNVALVAGTALAGAGAVKHHQNKKKQGVAKRAKKDHFGADATAAGGATTAVMAGGLSRTLDSEGKKWSKASAANVADAHAMNPKMGGYKVKPTTTRVPDVVPKRGDKSIPHDPRVFAGHTRAHAEAAGRLRGEAAQGRYFAKTYGKFAKITRGVGVGGAVVGAAGLGHRLYDSKHRKVKKNLAMRGMAGKTIPGIRRAVDDLGNIYAPPVKTATQVNPQRVLHTVRRPKRRLVRSGPRQRVSVTGSVGKALFPSAAKPVGMVKPKAPTGLTPPDLFAPKMGKVGGAVKPKPVMAPLKPKPMAGMTKPAGMKPKPAFR
jgi:hypothetical protein